MKTLFTEAQEWVDKKTYIDLRDTKNKLAEKVQTLELELEAVRGLVEKWREAEGKITEFGDPSAYDGDSCADELEALLNKEQTK